jgi:hypothetical protein
MREFCTVRFGGGEPTLAGASCNDQDAPFPAVRVTTSWAQVDPEPTLRAAGQGITNRAHLDGDEPVAKGATRDQVRKKLPILR